MSEVFEQPEDDRRRRRGWWLAGLVALVVVLVAGGWQLVGGNDQPSEVLGLGAGKAQPPSGQGTEVLGAQANRPELEAPTITSGPEEGEVSGAAVRFAYTHPQNGVNFACGLDNGPFARCPRGGVTYRNLPDGPHFFAVAVQQGNGPLSAPASRNWSVGAPAPQPPAQPQILSGPPSSTIDPDATFVLAAPPAEVVLECSLDGSVFVPCDATNTQTYEDLTTGAHTFFVWARSANGNGTSPVVPYAWAVVKAGFGISGDVVGLLAPGMTRPLNLTFTNPFNNAKGINLIDIAITVNDLTVRDGQANPACVGSLNLAVESGEAWKVNVPRRSTVSLQSLGIAENLWPKIKMHNLDVNQDACKNTVFTFSYTGTAEK